MKRVLQKEMVAKAIADIEASGKKVTNDVLYAALGRRGSMGTLIKFRAELKPAEQPVKDSEEGLRRFRDLWAWAKEEGRIQQESVVAGLQDDIQTLMRENERLEGEATAVASQTNEFQHAKSAMEAELANVRQELASSQQALIQAGRETQIALEKVSAEQSAHQSTQQELKKTIQRAHELELELARSRALLDAQNGQGVVPAKASPTATRSKSPKGA